MKITDHNILVDKAKSRKDGVYSYNGFVYLVKNKNFFAFAETSGEIYQVAGIIHVRIGKCEPWDRKNKLNSLATKQ